MSVLCCPCHALVHPPKPDIPAGLDSLPRQLVGFPEYRRAMLRDVPVFPPLEEWRAREGDDLGLMLLEMWAYVLDILGFYDERIANETYLRTAVVRASLRRLVELIGYRPRPAVGAFAVLAAIADGKQPMVLPPRTAFRSQAFDGEPPQVFETEAETLIDPKRNQWILAPVREALPSGDLLVEPGTARLSRDQLVLFRWTPSGASTAMLVPGRVVAADSVETLDGASYVRLQVDPPPALDSMVPLADVEILSPTLSAFPHQPVGSGFSIGSFFRAATRIGNGVLDAGEIRRVAIRARADSIALDSTYRQILEGDPVIVEHRGQLHGALVTSVTQVEKAMATAPDSPKVPVTELRLSPGLPSGWSTATGLRIHFNTLDAGRLTRVAKTLLWRDDVDGASLESLVEPFESEPPDELLLRDADDRGEWVGGSVAITPKGEGTVSVNQDEAEFTHALRTPVAVFGNLMEASRGESVTDEVLGSGDALRKFQSFTLRNKPLTYFNDPSAPEGRRSTLEIRVNGLLWSEMPSFFGAGPEDEVYIVRQNDEEESVVTFGDGVRGARLPSGMENVVARYRFGAGAAKPPAGAINQLARPVKGLRRVLNPVAAGGGADADTPSDLKKNAPVSALTLGRAISLPDFEALAREFGGVVNAHASWAWDEAYQRAVVQIWFISDGGEIAEELRAYLLGMTDPNTPLEVTAAEALPTELELDLLGDRRFNTNELERNVHEVLTNRDTGLLALEHVSIACPLFRSELFEQVLSVRGIEAVRRMALDGRVNGSVIPTPDGHYRDYMPGLTIHVAPE